MKTSEREKKKRCNYLLIVVKYYQCFFSCVCALIANKCVVIHHIQYKRDDWLFVVAGRREKNNDLMFEIAYRSICVMILCLCVFFIIIWGRFDCLRCPYSTDIIGLISADTKMFRDCFSHINNLKAICLLIFQVVFSFFF